MNFPQRCFKTTEKPSLAVCGSLCGEKQFYWFDKKNVLTNPNFPQDLPLSNMVEKQTF